MEGGSAFDRLDDLIDRIGDRLAELNAGALDLERLEQLCDDARELNERLIVLRHRARVEKVRGRGGERPIDPRQINLIQAIEHEKEARRAKRMEKKLTAEAAARQHDVAAEPQSPVIAAAAGAPPPEGPPGPIPPSKKVGKSSTQPREVPFRLVPPAPDRPSRPASTPAKATVADKLEHAPIADLAKAIVLSQKFWFINELFGRDASAYDKTIKRLNAAGGLEEALSILQEDVTGKQKKSPNDAALAELMDLIQRRFST
jgi:hypothetical protein